MVKGGESVLQRAEVHNLPAAVRTARCYSGDQLYRDAGHKRIGAL